MTLEELLKQQPPQAPGKIEKPQGLPSKIWDSLKIPEQKSREGLEMITNAITPSMTDIEAGKVGKAGMAARAGMEALSEVAPSFVSKGAILTAGALKGAKLAAPVIKAAGRGLAGQLESASGISPKGSLNAAYNDATQIFSKGKKSASPLYEAAKSEIPEGSSLFSKMYKPEQILDKAIEYQSSGGKLEAAEALTVRKAIDKLLGKKGYIQDELLKLRGQFDEIAKSSENIRLADPTYLRGARGEALRNILPQNKLGGASPFKAMLATMTKGALLPIVSPVMQGAGATAAGLVGRYGVAPLVNNPALGFMAPQAIDKTKQAIQAIFGNRE